MRNTIAALLLLVPALAVPSRPPAAEVEPRTLIVCVDGINFSDFEYWQRRGRFSYLRRPARLIAPFPSLTNPSMVEILQPAGAPPSPGYEDRYFDLHTGKLRGGILKRLGPGFVRGTFRELFDFHPPGFLSGFEYLLPPFSCEAMFAADLHAGLRAFRRSRGSVFRVYLGASDCAAHTGDLNSARELLRDLDGALERVARREPGLRLLLFSDHGNAYGSYRRVRLDRVLERHGYRLGRRVKRTADVVVPQFGLIGAAMVFARESNAVDVARLLSSVEGVHFASVAREGAVRIFRHSAEARIVDRQGRLRYLPGEADPFELKAAAELSPEEWFEATRAHRYPDPVNRVWEQSREAVDHPAQVLVSLERGYYTGSPALDVFVQLRATHGSLDAEQSLGFLASSEADLPEYLRTRDAGEILLGLGF